MMNKTGRKMMLAFALAASVCMLATGCDKLKKEPETEKVTEAPTEKQTEPPTEKVTEAPTEKQTEPPTETETETESETQPKVLTVEEEKAQETEFDQLRTMYAMDDVNVRAEPGTDGEIFSSFYQGDKVIVVVETPNWCVVDLEDYDTNGYVSKQFLSDTQVDPKTDEERQQLIEQELSGSAAGSGETSADTSSAGGSTDTSSVDLEYNVGAFAESFTVYAMTGANLRSTPAQDGEIIQTVASGTSVKAVGETDRWYKVDVDGTIGYVNKNLFSTEPQ